MGVTFVSDRIISRYNQRYLHRKGATDVLSFPMNDRRLLGDVMISLDTASRQARAAKKTVREQSLFLIIHGILHLIGYDHITRAEKQVMQKKERTLRSLCEE